jgi:pectinesterase
MEQRVVRVAANGTGDYAKVQDAIDSVPLNNHVPTIILISPGEYCEPVYVPKTKNFITFHGLQPETTIISWDNTHARINHHQVFIFLSIVYLSYTFKSPNIYFSFVNF